MSNLGLIMKTVLVLKIDEKDLKLVEYCIHSSLAQNQQISSIKNILKIKDTESEASLLFRGP